MDTLSALVFFLFFSISKNLIQASPDECPADCICYPEYLSNLASWKWVENDIATQKDDLAHRLFNPYTEHNEVMENPTAHIQRMQEGTMLTVTCIIRNKSSKMMIKTLKSLPTSTQVLSLLQAPGSGNLTLEKHHLENLNSLVGLEVQGYFTKSADQGDTFFSVAADAFLNIRKLRYLNLENVILLQRNVENQVHDSTSKFLRINYTTNEDEISNDISSQLLLLSPPDKEEKNPILPYNVYKSEYKGNNGKLMSQNLMEPKIAVCFTSLLNLNHLRISGCNMQDISWDMFFKLNNLKFLLLESNDLLFLPDFVFYSTMNLTALSLARNRILSLQTVGLAGLLYLQKLDVTHNNITHLSELSLPPFPHLEVADFRYNPIEAIFPNTFEVMNSTKTLFLGDPTTKLEFFPNSFYGLISLQRLDILNVKIGFLERPMLKGMPVLQSLTMQGIVHRISYDAFSEVPKLEKLILRNCSVRKISMDAFYGLHSLMELDLSYNELTFLPPGLFDEQTSLREVSLRHNKLTSLPSDLFQTIPAKMIRLEMNPWHCSCEMALWNPDVVNKVKRFYIANNDTYCQRQYDKGSMCNQTNQPSFQAKYVYEKRVSPLCETPDKFSNKNVFTVIKKQLSYCVTQKLEILNATQSLPSPNIPTNKTAKWSLKKEIERQRYFANRPVKVQKPLKPSNTTTTEYSLIVSTTQNSSNNITTTESHLADSTTESSSLSGKTSTPITDNTTPTPQFVIERNESLSTQASTFTTMGLTDTTPIIHRTTTEILATIRPNRQKIMPAIIKPTKPPRQNINSGGQANQARSSNGTTAISRKALKLAKLLKSQRMG